jgi:hypothetical protein
MQKYLIFSIILACVVACKAPTDSDIAYDCSTIAIPTYTNTIKTIMDTSCATANCHDAIKKAAGYDLSTYEATKLNVDAKLLRTVEHRSDVDPMPKGADQIPEAQRRAIYCWAQNGTPE